MGCLYYMDISRLFTIDSRKPKRIVGGLIIWQ
nr:MAG TPA: hypothetical protein [Bacteriophage sp.]